MVMEKGKVQEISSLPFRPCDGIKDSSWQKQSLVLNPRRLMHIGGRVRQLDGVSFTGICFSANAFGLWLFDSTFTFSVKQDVRALKLDPRHSSNPTDPDLIVDGACSPRFYGD